MLKFISLESKETLQFFQRIGCFMQSKNLTIGSHDQEAPITFKYCLEILQNFVMKLEQMRSSEGAENRLQALNKQNFLINF